ncbi:MAG TPA: hypothetical protein VGD00_04780 [Solirubrobacteraceae bacterium]
MATLLADSTDTAVQTPEGAPPQPPLDGDGAPPAPGPQQPSAAAACTNCGAAMAPGQDWCLNCGTAARGSVGGARWRGVAVIALATTLLVLGAAAAGWAALSKHPRRAPVRTTTVAQAVPPAATPPAATPPQTFSTPSTTAPPAISKAPTIPLKAATPTTTAPVPTTPTTPGSEGTAGAGNSNSGGSSGEKQREPILLDTNAASTYNPYDYPASGFGDPSLTIDGDGSTGWTAQVNPATAPKLAEGLLIDLKSPHKLSTAKLITTTPGMNVQVYGSAASTPPSSITDPAWVPISHSLKLHKRHASIGLLKPKRSFRFVVVWISAAPPSAIGTAEAPGHVTIDELELFAPAG